MEIRYIGFEQGQKFRVYRFDVRTDGRVTQQASVTTDIAVFRNHRVGIQEGPLLCGSKLTADLERGWDGEHELTDADVRSYVDAKALAHSRHVSARRPPRRSGLQPDALKKSPWRKFGI